MPTVTVGQSAALQNRQNLSQLVSASNTWLEAEIGGPSLEHLEWDVESDERGRDVLVLRVRDVHEGQVTARFSPAELENEHHARTRFHEIQGSLIQVGSFRRSVRALVDNAKAWLGDMESPPACQEETITLKEQRTGEYEVPMLRIWEAGKEIRLEPVACFVVGADGRVDLIGPLDTFKIVLHGTGRWQWVEDRIGRPPRDLDQELFSDLIAAAVK